MDSLLSLSDTSASGTAASFVDGCCIDGSAQKQFLEHARDGLLPGGAVACNDAQGRFPSGRYAPAIQLHPVSVQCVDGGRSIRFDWPHAMDAWFQVPVAAIQAAIAQAPSTEGDESSDDTKE